MNDENLPPGRLVVVEYEGGFVVVDEDDPSDWVAAFTQNETFPARAWAERMAEIFNLRSEKRVTDELAEEYKGAPVFTGTHHPAQEPGTEEG